MHLTLGFLGRDPDELIALKEKLINSRLCKNTTFSSHFKNHKIR